MEFYSTYYKKLANYEQINKIGEKFDLLDANDDKALNATEVANIFAQVQNLPLEEKEAFIADFMTGIDQDNDGFINYSEFIPTFLEFDIDQDGDFSNAEFDFTKKKIEELEKQTDINTQYKILNDVTKTEQEKQNAQNQIDIFKTERNIIYAEQDIKKKQIIVGNIDYKIGQIQQFINDNTLLEFDEAKKIKEIENLEVQKVLLLLEKDLSVKTKDLETVKLDIITATGNGDANQLSILEQLKISKENELKVSERNLELQHKQAKIDNNESLLTKFFIPEIVKENARKELDLLYDQKQLLSQRIDLYSKISILSQTRAKLLDEDYQGQKQQLEADQIIQQRQAQISSLKVELLDKQIQLKAVLPKSDRKPFDAVKATLETEIAEKQSQIAALESQL